MQRKHPLFATFSIAAVDPLTQECGIAVASKALAVGSVVPWARAGVGCVVTQANANPEFGPEGLRLLADGADPADVIEELLRGDPDPEDRQVAVIGARGGAAAFTGSANPTWSGHQAADTVAVQGNTLAGPEVISAMRRRFDDVGGPLAARLLAALVAAEEAGGDRRGKQSAALLVVKPGGGFGGRGDRYIDLRVDDHREPVAELVHLHELWSMHYELPDEEALPLDGRLASEVRALLSALGYAVAPGTCWDDETAAALAAFNVDENLYVRARTDDLIDPTFLGHLRNVAARANQHRPH